MLKEILKEELQKYGVDWSLEEFQKQIELAIMNDHKEYIISKITKNGLKIFHNKKFATNKKIAPRKNKFSSLVCEICRTITY